MHHVNIGGDDEELAAQVLHAGRVRGTAREDTPRLAGGGRRFRDRLDRLEAAGILEVSRDAEDLAQVGRADEQEVDVRDGRDLGSRLQGARRLDLDADEGLGIGPRGVLGEGDQAVPAVAIAAVEAAFAPGPELEQPAAPRLLDPPRATGPYSASPRRRRPPARA